MRQAREHIRPTFRHTAAVALMVGVALVPAFPRSSAAAVPTLRNVLDKKLPDRLRGRTEAADSKKLLPGTAQPYAHARAALADGQPALALTALKGKRSALFADREALVRGEALAALGDHQAALNAFLTALESAEVLSVGLDAARGLRRTLNALGHRQAELTVTEALLGIRNVANRPQLLLAKADALAALNRSEDAAAQAWRLMLAYPTSSVAAEAEALLKKLESAGTEIPTATSRFELARIRNLISARAYKKAEQAIQRFEKTYPKLEHAALMQRIELLHRQRKRDDEKVLLEMLYRRGLEADDGPKVLYRLARLAMYKDDNDTAIKYFDELKRRFPRSGLAREGMYLAAWLPYDSGNNLETHRRMLAFEKAYPRSSKRTEALWFAGWAAYLENRTVLAEAAWLRLITKHPRSTLVPNAWYWLGRISQASKKRAEAQTRFGKVLEVAPMSYYGFWAQRRLAELGKETEFPPPPSVKIEAPSVADVVRRLGEKRPRLIDRGIALHAAGLEEEAAEELRAAERALRDVRDDEGRIMVSGMLHQLGAHYLAFRLASTVTGEGSELTSGESLPWRAWRQSYPMAFADEVHAAHEAHEVEKNLVWAVMRTESAYRPWVRSRVGARGLMQLMPKTARAIGRTAEDGRRHAARYRDPKSNVWLGAWYLKKLSERYDGQLAAMIGAYNAGPIAMDKWVRKLGGIPLDEFIERIPYKETRRYTRRVIESYFVYRRIKGLPLPELPQVLAKAEPSGGVRF